MTDRELMKQALKALDRVMRHGSAVQEAKDILRAALRDGTEQPLRTHWEGCEQVHPECRKPEQEPVAWMIWTQGPVSTFLKKYEAESEFDRLNRQYPEPSRKLIALYTAPPRREWVGLTEKEELMVGVATGLTGIAIRMIEAKLREKNNV